MTNNHQNDIEAVVNDAGFQLKSVVKNHGGKYRFFDKNVDDFLVATRKGTNVKEYLKSTSRGVAYREEVDVYFIFEQCASRASV